MTVANQYNQYYDARWLAEDSSDAPPAAARVQLVSETVSSLCGKRSPRILDVGCGNGWILSAIEKLTKGRPELFGVEPSRRGTQNSRERVPNAHIELGTLESVYHGDTFDIIVTSEVIEHVTDQRQFIAEIASALKLGGILILTTPNGKYRNSYFNDKPDRTPQPIENWVTVPQLCSLVSPQFKIRSVRTFNPGIYYETNLTMARLRRLFQSAPAGRHFRSRLDKTVCTNLSSGLGIMGVFQKR